MPIPAFLQSHHSGAAGGGSDVATPTSEVLGTRLTGGFDSELDVYLVHWIRFLEAFQVGVLRLPRGIGNANGINDCLCFALLCFALLCLLRIS